MNLNAVVSKAISSVNPMAQVGLQISNGYATADDGTQVPSYATPLVFQGSIGGAATCTSSGAILTVASISGSLWPGDAVSGSDGTNSILAGTVVVSQVTGTPGQAGTYLLSATPTGDLSTCSVAISSTVLNVTGITEGSVVPGEVLEGAGVVAGTSITAAITGGGDVGTYRVSIPQTVVPTTISGSMTVLAQVQPLSYRDLVQISGINVNGIKKAIYINGLLDGVVRPEIKGGDLVTLPDGSTWLVVLPLEQWNQSGWCKAAIVLQNDAQFGYGHQSDAQPLGSP